MRVKYYNKQMRFFIALEIPEESRVQIKKIQDTLATLIPEARITENEKLHLTLAFIGEQHDNLKENLIELINNAAKDIAAFEITPAYIDGFPTLHHPDIFWVGVKGDIDKLFLIRERIKDGLENLNLMADERRFIPHIAIAKIQEFEVSEQLEEKLQTIVPSGMAPVRVTSIKLFESIPNEGFHHHNTLAEIKLG